MDNRVHDVRVRDIRRGDLEPMVRLWGDDDVARFMGDYGPRTRGEVQTWLDDVLRWNARPPEHGRTCGIVHTTTDEVLGWIGFGTPERAIPADMDFGYAVLPEHRGRGIATAALSLVLQHCLEELGLSAVYGECSRDNVASALVMSRAGMRAVAASAADQQGFLRERPKPA